MQTRRYNLSSLELHISFRARTVSPLSVVGQLKELKLCFYYSPSTEYQSLARNAQRESISVGLSSQSVRSVSSVLRLVSKN